MKSLIINNTEWTVDRIKSSVETNDESVKKILLTIYSFQTEDEQRVQHTKHYNGMGFNGADSPILSSLAEQLKTKGWLSPKQIAVARKKCRKYASQYLQYLTNKYQN